MDRRSFASDSRTPKRTSNGTIHASGCSFAGARLDGTRDRAVRVPCTLVHPAPWRCFPAPLCQSRPVVATSPSGACLTPSTFPPEHRDDPVSSIPPVPSGSENILPCRGVGASDPPPSVLSHPRMQTHPGTSGGGSGRATDADTPPIADTPGGWLGGKGALGVVWREPCWAQHDGRELERSLTHHTCGIEATNEREGPGKGGGRRKGRDGIHVRDAGHAAEDGACSGRKERAHRRKTGETTLERNEEGCGGRRERTQERPLMRRLARRKRRKNTSKIRATGCPPNGSGTCTIDTPSVSLEKKPWITRSSQPTTG